MNWYLSKIVFQIICGNGEHTAQFDEQIRLVSAENEEAAFEKAREMGRQEEESFFNRKEQLVQWKFIDVCELYKLSGLIDGAELYSRINEVEDGKAYVSLIQRRAELLRVKESRQLLHLI